MKSCSNETHRFLYRSKFEKLISKFTKVQRKKLDAIFENFIAEPDDVRCAQILWALTYCEWSGLYSLGIKVHDDFIMEDILVPDVPEKFLEIPQTLVLPLRNELRFQRKRVHSNFLTVHYPDGCEQTFKVMLHSMNDPVLTYQACEHCHQICYTSSEVEINRILFLLNCTKKENIFGGIRSLKFSPSQSEYFMKYHTEIRDYLESVWVSITHNLEPEAHSYSSTGVLYHQLEDWCKAHPGVLAGCDNADDSNNEEALPIEYSTSELNDSTSEVASSPTLSVSNILADKMLFSQFLVSFNQLASKGYDCEEIMKRKGKIEAILSLHSMTDEYKLL